MGEMFKSLLDMAEEFEKTGAQFYEENVSKVKPRLVKETFSWLAEMEREHVEFIKILKKSLAANEELPPLPEDRSGVFQEKLEKQKLDPTNLEGDLADVSVLRMALLVEQDFENLYRRAAEKTENEAAKRVLQALARWEKGHVQIISELISSLLDKLRIGTGFYPIDF